MEQIRVEHISYSYQNQYQKIEAVKDISCGFEAGSLYAIVGESGSGKSNIFVAVGKDWIRRTPVGC